MTIEYQIKYLDDLAEKNPCQLAWDMREAIRAGRDALRKQAEREKCEQWLDDIDNPFEPIKIEAALRSEMMKMEFRRSNKPKDISLLDYTIIAVLHDALERALKGQKDEGA